MQIQENISLKPFNTFAIDVPAAYFARIDNVADLPAVYQFAEAHGGIPVTVIGGGSNILLTHPVNGLVVRNELAGIRMVDEDHKHVYVQAAAGENWHRFVLYCIENNFAGAENLSLIPGSVGASPMQNIGAYGVEVKDIFYELEAFNITSGAIEKFGLADCEFGYRESVFKKRLKGKYVITNVTFKLDKEPRFHTAYGAIQQELEQMGVTELSIGAISQAVINIRSSKLPDPKQTGNAGSFFKNPTIPKAQFDQLKTEFPDIVGFATGDEEVKVAAGWLIENAGWKGYRKGDAGCHAKQALVLVNYGNASGMDIYGLSTEIVQSIEQRFGILLEREVNVM